MVKEITRVINKQNPLVTVSWCHESSLSLWLEYKKISLLQRGESSLISPIPCRSKFILCLSSQKVLTFRQLRPSLCHLLFLNLPHKLPILLAFLYFLFPAFVSYIFQLSQYKWSEIFCVPELKLLCLLMECYKGIFLATRVPWKENVTGMEYCTWDLLGTRVCSSWLHCNANQMVP